MLVVAIHVGTTFHHCSLSPQQVSIVVDDSPTDGWFITTNGVVGYNLSDGSGLLTIFVWLVMLRDGQ